MAFKNLEQRFNETADKLYAGAKYKFDNGKASRGRNDDPLIVRKPGDGYWNAAEGRSTPISSAFTDLKRMTLFTASTRGLKFLAKQQILQTGNTFESTRIINPAFHISNAVPFIHTKRAIDIPITKSGIARAILGNNALTKKIFGSGAQKTDIASLRKIGQLQVETYDKATQAINVKSLIKKIPVIGQTISAVRAKRSVGDGVKPFEESRPELSKLGARGLVTALFSGNNSSTSGYIMANQVILNSKLNDKYITNFKPKYFVKLDGKYVTYTNLSDGESKWKVGQRLNDYIRLRSKAVSTAGKTKTDFLNSTLNIGQSATAKKTRLEEIYKKSTDNTIINGNIKLDRYVDYGTSARYGKKQYYNVPTVPNAKKKIQNVLYPSASSTIDAGVSTYVLGLAAESQTLSELPSAIVKTSGQPIIKNASLSGVSYIKYFTYGAGTVKQANEDEIKSGKLTNARDLALGPDGKRRSISYIKDVSNILREEKNSLVSREAYNTIESVFDDPIVVSFAMGIDGHVRFRAYIKDLQQNTSPQYNPLQYIGRMEKFIYYTGVQREVSFKIGLVAFSQDELDGMWRRINYLTGMAYPYGFNKGIFQPNIVRMTIGDVYTDQPGYITSLNTNFTEITETWELSSGQQVPISAMMSMNFVLIEKASRLGDSPFYGITENLPGFSKTIPTATANADGPPTTGEPTDQVVDLRKPPVPPNPLSNTSFGGFGGTGGPAIAPVGAGGSRNPFAGLGTGG